MLCKYFCLVVKRPFDFSGGDVEKNDIKQHKIESRTRILQAAISLFSRHGFAETGMRELVAEADVNLSMVNYFFGSKKGLLKEILDGFFSGYLAIANDNLVAVGDLHERLERFISSAVRYFDANRDSLVIAISELPHDDPEILEYKAGWARQMVEIINQEICLPHAAKGGQYISPTCFAPMLTTIMASRFLFAPVMKKVEEDSSTAVTIEEYTEMIVWIFLQGIRTL
jgi:AcrR family transcriptional regulator